MLTLHDDINCWVIIQILEAKQCTIALEKWCPWVQEELGQLSVGWRPIGHVALNKCIDHCAWRGWLEAKKNGKMQAKDASSGSSNGGELVAIRRI